ncbi:MAG: oxidoreductase [Gemmatimonadetes bacterium]|nr:oxidoreductase [Gemmatimonadota bacterium]NIO31884.1 oxidoreductase [Gemmatimonadota bacterium]
MSTRIRDCLETGPLLLAAVAACAEFGEPVMQDSGTTAEFRGLSAASGDVVWAGGRGGVFARTVDGGATWAVDTVDGASTLFFIDAHAVDASTAYLLGTDFEGGEARIYKTTDGGSTWTLQYRDTTPGVFFDGMAFWDAAHGVAFSDPLDGGLLIVTTNDGARWSRVPQENVPPALPGEGGFAASGTAVAVYGSDHVWIGTGGGTVARVYRSSDRGRTWQVAETPLPSGPTAGIFGIAFRDSLNGVAVGGDYTQRTEPGANVIRTADGGLSWTSAASSLPAGCRYGATYVPGTRAQVLAATGPSGWGLSRDDGATWTVVDTVGYNTIAAAPSGGALWVAGVEGRIARLSK